MSYLDNFDLCEFIKDLTKNGYAKLPSIINLPNFDELKNNAINELGNKTFKANLKIHNKILNLMNFEQIILPELIKIAKQQFNFNDELNNSYHIARLIKPSQKNEGYRCHFDSHIFTMVLPILIPTEKNIEDKGQLICFPNFRPHPKNELINIIEKVYYKRYASKKLIEKLISKKKYIEFSFEDYQPLIFFGTKTLHLNKNIDKRINNKRLTFLSHYFDTSSKFGIGNFMRILRKR